jgi:hypothetical protein
MSVSLSAKIAAVASAVYPVAAPAQAYCTYPVASGASGAAGAATFMQIPNFASEGVIAAVQISYRQDRFGQFEDEGRMPSHAVAPPTGNSCRTEFGSKALPLGPAMLGGACGFRLSDGTFVEGVIAQ